jgi:complex iron-sulfur molybdoenzyme family reductase subunit gamma
LILLVLAAAVSMRLFDIKPAVAQSPILTVWESTLDPGLDPASIVWEEIPPLLVQLTAQNVTPPMGERGVPRVAVRAVHFGGMLYVNLRWTDVTADDKTDRVGVFADAVAVQFPAMAATSVPAICMGQADTAVNIWHWRADSQAGIAELPNRGYVDLYPELDELYYPAAAAGNVLATASPVQNLVAGGFGTLAPVDDQVIAGVGAHDERGWSVTMARAFAPPGANQPTFTVGARSDVAFAVWDGSNGDRDGQKSVSSFVRLEIAADGYPAPGLASVPERPWIDLVTILIALSAGIAFVLWISRTSAGGEDEQAAVGE